MKHFLSVVALAVAVFPIADLSCQEPVARTLVPEVEIRELQLNLVPLTKVELELEVAAWIELLKAKATEVSRAEIEQSRLEGEARAAVTEEVGLLRRERGAIEDRVNTVLAAWEEKGGEVAEQEAYVRAVSTSGVIVDLVEPSAAWTAVTTWFKSPDGGLRWGRNIVLFLITLIAFRILAGILGGITSRAVTTYRQTPELLRNFFINAVRKVTNLTGIVVALSMLEINIAPLLAAMGAAGFVIGFALQGTLSNFACGVMILLYRPYEIGDYVMVAKVAGTVDAMTLVSTTVKTPDNQTVVIPNSKIWGDVITNVTANDTRRVDLTFRIGIGDDVAQGQQTLEALVHNHPLVLKDPEPVIAVHELTNSSVNFAVRPWCRTSDYWTVYWDLTRTVKERFDAEGITIR